MPGYLEGYGAGEAQREKKLRWIVVSIVGVLLVSGLLYANLRDYKEERILKQFLEALKRQDYKSAYSMWGCTVELPCRDYALDKFMEDWGPNGVNAKYAAGGITDTERCGSGFMGVLHQGKEELSLWVERSNGALSYAPWPQCPEKKLRLMRWLKMRFGNG
ncbi:MAG TPA: hypothetical protein VM120_07690 [Bryobacteraceae bacterium]|nr:hypothetical protein [Bryobacteraceae bacterium]